MNRDLDVDKERARGKDVDKRRDGDVPRWHGYHRSASVVWMLPKWIRCVLGTIEERKE